MQLALVDNEGRNDQLSHRNQCMLQDALDEVFGKTIHLIDAM
jgi:hypothetical protein